MLLRALKDSTFGAMLLNAEISRQLSRLKRLLHQKRKVKISFALNAAQQTPQVQILRKLWHSAFQTITNPLAC